MLSRRQLTAAAIALTMVTMSLFVAVTPALAGEGAERTEGEEVPVAILQQGTNEPFVVPYYVKCQSGTVVMSAGLSPAALQTNDTEAVITVPGQTFGRYFGTRVGEFSMIISQHMDLLVYGVRHVAIWAKANEDVQNARFTVYLQRNGNSLRTMQTNTAQLSTLPLEFSVASPPSFVEPEVFERGDTLSMAFSYFSNPRRLFGPNPGCEVLANSLQHATRIELLCKPLEGNVTTPSIGTGEQDQLVHLRGRVLDTSDVDPRNDLHVNLEIIPSGVGTVKPDHIQQMNFVIRDSDYIINWTWDWKKSQVTDGLFEFKLDVSYGVLGSNYTNSSFYELKFPKADREDAWISTTAMVGMAIAILAVVAVVGFLMYRRSSTRTPYGYPPRRGPPPKAPKRAKKPKLTRAQKKAMKKGGPPPGGRPPNGRTPMPGKSPPGPHAPPSGMPPGKPRAPGAGTARPRRR